MNDSAVSVPAAILELVDEQAEDEGLWFLAETAPEAYLQQELRRLHRAVEENAGGSARHINRNDEAR